MCKASRAIKRNDRVDAGRSSIGASSDSSAALLASSWPKRFSPKPMAAPLVVTNTTWRAPLATARTCDATSVGSQPPNGSSQT
jgi:hypothetical protein